MSDVTRERIRRKIDALPEEQLYQVLDFIEFLESKHAPDRPTGARGFQGFAERFEDQMRARNLAPRVMGSAMKIAGTAGRVLDDVASVGRDLLDPSRPGGSSAREGSARGTALQKTRRQIAPPGNDRESSE